MSFLCGKWIFNWVSQKVAPVPNPKYNLFRICNAVILLRLPFGMLMIRATWPGSYNYRYSTSASPWSCVSDPDSRSQAETAWIQIRKRIPIFDWIRIQRIPMDPKHWLFSTWRPPPSDRRPALLWCWGNGRQAAAWPAGGRGHPWRSHNGDQHPHPCLNTRHWR